MHTEENNFKRICGDEIGGMNGEQVIERNNEDERNKKKKMYKIVSLMISCMVLLGVLTGYVETSLLTQCEPCLKALSGAIQNTHNNDSFVILDNATQWR